MVLNIASCALIIQNYNNGDSLINETEFALSLAQLVILCIGIAVDLILWHKIKYHVILIPYLAAQIFSLIFSVYIIINYNNNVHVNIDLYNLSITIIVNNICSFFGYLYFINPYPLGSPYFLDPDSSFI